MGKTKEKRPPLKQKMWDKKRHLLKGDPSSSLFKVYSKDVKGVKIGENKNPRETKEI